ncbi:hypothetical protein FNU76_15885 [Chitinimonas arctica]|uniref:Uncharacterized protein n=2 Tax=Chitinimonas arctica TaxID=2594795 RepID=A0A516SHS5_9NEIS|nr:hypothetical protein FNU76_15885 [Chitinimonas arctica]
MKTNPYALGAMLVCLLSLPGCASAPPSPKLALTVTGCPTLSACRLPASQPQTNRDLLREVEALEQAWAECAAQVDLTLACQADAHAQTTATP